MTDRTLTPLRLVTRLRNGLPLAPGSSSYITPLVSTRPRDQPGYGRGAQHDGRRGRQPHVGQGGDVKAETVSGGVFRGRHERGGGGGRSEEGRSDGEAGEVKRRDGPA